MITQQLDAFSSAPADRLPGAFRDLLGEFWDGDEAVGDAPGAAARLTDALAVVPADRQPHLVIALGLLADTEHPEVRAALRERLDYYTKLVPDADRPLLLALVYLLGHFPEDRDRVLAAFEGSGLSPDEESRLDRSLGSFDPGSPGIGRVWPSPLAWSLTDAERAKDLEWTSTLPAEVVAGAWHEDTRTLHAYSGAKALRAVEHGLGPDVDEPEVVAPTVPRAPAGVGPATWARFADAIRCPSCRWPLAESADDASCTGCGTAYPVVDGCLDLRSAQAGPGEAVFRAAFTRYERTLRPPVLRLSGSNWDGVVTPADEDAYLVEHVRPADGPVVDLGSGPGRWTAVLAGHLGPERIIALDSSPTMLGMVGEALPDVVRISGDAMDLPFADGSVGAVNSWNMLQALPDPAKAVAEVGRCLRPGGTFTLLTYLTSDDPVYAFFQKRLTLTTFDLDELRQWFAAAGLTVRSQSTPGTFLLLTAVRDAG